MLTVRQIHDESLWDIFVCSQVYTLFVQSAHYGKFYEAIGEHYWIFCLYDGETIVGGSLVLSVHAKRGNFLYIPYGPILDYSKQEQVTHFFYALREFAKEKKYDFIRVSPFIDDTPENKKIFADQGYRSAPMHLLAETTWMLDITDTEETLLAN